LVFSYENLDNAKAAYDKLIARTAQLISANDGSGVNQADFDRLKAVFTAAMDDDVNTSNAITAVYDVLKADTNPATKLALLDDFDKVLSLDITANAKKSIEENSAQDIPQKVLDLVEQRKEARKAKDFALADQLRDKISELGYNIRETRQGTEITKK
ncbi:MAG: DALR domain-containing protein, partial [Oscillospiraceae bacterium]